jgi:predicted transcriptional regulator
MTISVNLPADVAARLSEKAAQGGQDVAGYLQQLAVRDAELWNPVQLAEWDALLDTFDEGSVEDHQETVAVLAHGLNEDRLGQRRIFGTGYNPLRNPSE